MTRQKATTPDRVAAARELRHDASVLKMRAMRLRALGDEDGDQWQATLQFHRAAEKELAALAALGRAGADEQAGARVEACGLFVEAGDPVRAATEWFHLVRQMIGASPATGLLARLQPRYDELVDRFTVSWRELEPMLAEAGSSRSAPLARKLRTLLEACPGMAELWWKLAMHTRDSDEAALARSRMIAIDATLADEDTARQRWDAVARALMCPLTLEMVAEESPGGLLLDQVNRIAAVFDRFFRSFVEAMLGQSIDLVPLAARTGSFVFDIAAWGMPPYALAELDRVLAEAPAQAGAHGLMALVSLLQEARVRLRVTTAAANTSLVIDARRRRELLDAARQAALTTIDSRDVPQANDLDRVFDIVARMARHDEVSDRTLHITRRQVAYYRQAARVLGLCDEAGQLTAAGRLVSRLDPDDRLRATVLYFEASVCGEAWIRWSRGRTLRDVTPDSALAFLEECVPGLARHTAGRRAQTLIAWYDVLTPHHYGAG